MRLALEGGGTWLGTGRGSQLPFGRWPLVLSLCEWHKSSLSGTLAGHVYNQAVSSFL